MGAVVSQTRVKSLGTENDIQPQKHLTSWTRYHCQVRRLICVITSCSVHAAALNVLEKMAISNSLANWILYFQVEVEKKWIETESQRQSGCMTQ